MSVQNPSGDTKFTVFIRLPFPRGDFVDPPPVEWDAAKDQTLWDILSRPSKGDDIDWKALADKFDVTLQFLLQQAAWLYDRQLSQVRAQMRKVPIPSNSPSLIPGSASGSTALGGQPMKPTTSTGSRVPTRLPSHQKDTLPQRTVGPRRASSNSTINQVKARGESTRNDTPTAEIKEPKWEGFAQRSSAAHHAPAPAAPIRRSPTLEEDDMSSSSSGSESDEEEDGRRGHKFRHFGMYSIQKAGPRDDEDDDDDDDDSPAFLPFSHGTEHQARESTGQDLHETLRLNEQAGSQRRRMAEHNNPPRTPVTESSTSSTSSGVPVSLPPSENRRRVHNFPSTLSPRRGPRLSPRRSAISGRETSDGTPSMGSSYSDLDDTSVTQSALEEALLSNMQHGGMASRMSTISQALRSRVLP